MKNKRMTIANFNVVFGEKEKPLLNYFSNIVMPALHSSLVRSKGDNDYIFMNIEVVDVEKNDFVLTGIIVKKTVLEVFSKFDEQEHFIKTNELHPTAPYSLFTIYLKNHRMILVKNQKGSPDLRNFSATIRYVMDRYIREENLKRKKEEMESLPYPIVNIIGIPMRESIEEALKKVIRINKLTLKFYPLNGDIDFSGLFNGMTTDLRKKVGSKTGDLTLNSPTSVSGITEVLTAAEGTIEPIFKVTYSDKSKGKIQNGTLSENMEISYDDTNVAVAVAQITTKTKDLKSLSSVSEGNQKIYNQNISNIIPFVKMKNK